jgi:hypothetical protein
MPGADPREAGRKGGRSRSLKKILAARRNGFQRQSPKPLEGKTPQQPLITLEEPRATSSNA